METGSASESALGVHPGRAPARRKAAKKKEMDTREMGMGRRLDGEGI